VTFDGFLIVENLAKPGVDTGLRFSEVDEEKGLYRCPVAVRMSKFPKRRYDAGENI
jgi:hypothetical protein